MRTGRSRCPVARSLDIVGDHWSLLLIRDLVRGKRRFAEFAASPEGIPTNILSSRLKRLQKAGVIGAHRYSAHPPRVEYVLTQKGEDLRPILRAMVEWGIRHAGGRVPPPLPGSATPTTS
jgi:DNA-binding HxlR family transcriptional regulator